MAGRGPIELDADTQDFVDLLGRTSRLEPALKKAIRKKVREAGMEAAKAAKAEVLKPPLGRSSGRQRSTGLRRGLAKSIKVKIAASARGRTVGVVIRSSGAGLDPARRRLVRRYNKASGWRHPLFGNREHWYPQKGRPYWNSVMSREKAVLARKVREALDEALETLD